jgi:hypothetical protein
MWMVGKTLWRAAMNSWPRWYTFAWYSGKVFRGSRMVVVVGRKEKGLP